MLPRKENKQFMFKRPKLPNSFQGRVFKGNVRDKDCRVPDQLVNILLIGWW